eukprot:CAMPEP_0202969796 /NCGR_PEP_ID=MMETSP1396-20130829/15673_1 /ASSEMBLY_ACC=CAM_ASM_000872 /TAXON_ID= /ORGANISM="Pseudokeronopsis sp., Strain Brazil" /LENGTH=76 /DNA_ID=CAMNT_0049697759 /DNA_START=91 /DNA_END=321 /DNA_ORIENTATION=-
MKARAISNDTTAMNTTFDSSPLAHGLELLKFEESSDAISSHFGNKIPESSLDRSGRKQLQTQKSVPEIVIHDANQE